MDNCEPIRPSLYRIIDGEADPAEAIGVARHVSNCTACRILLARKRRLAEMLENDLKDLPVEDGFVDTVMSTLPEGPPPRRRHLRRGLRLAGLAGLIGLSGPLLVRGVHWGAPQAPIFAFPSFDPELADGTLRGLGVVVRVAVSAIDALGGLAPAFGALLPHAASLAAALGLSALLLLAGGSTLVLLAAGSVSRRAPRARSGGN